jgi:hypothetical protein
MYRGNINKQPNVNFAYRLPVAVGDDVLAEIVENRFGYQLRFSFLNDTVFASRGGIICNDNLTDFSARGHQTFNSSRNSQITVYHADGSFGEYIFHGKSLVNPGQSISMGTPIAVVQTNQDNEGWMLFSAYFLDRNKVRDLNQGNKHTNFRPFFQTYDSGKTRMENDFKYVAIQTDEMLVQDMNRREKRDFLRNRTR